LSTETIAPGKKHLLLVDDDRLVLQSLAVGLEQAGYQVTTVETAEEAEGWLTSGVRPDLAILDVRMPGRGGLHLAQRLKQIDHIPFMMFSAYGDPKIVSQAMEFGAMGYAVKPLDIEQLLPAIETAMARADEMQELRLARQQLQQALDGDRSINIATGIVMISCNLARPAAFNRLRDTARSQRRKLADMAQEIIDASEALSRLAAPQQPNRRLTVLDAITKPEIYRLPAAHLPVDSQ